MDHVAHGSAHHFGRRHLTADNKLFYRPNTVNGGMIHALRYGHHGRGYSGRGIMANRSGGALPVSETIPTPYNVQLPGGRMKRPSQMTKERVIAKLQKIQARS